MSVCFASAGSTHRQNSNAERLPHTNKMSDADSEVQKEKYRFRARKRKLPLVKEMEESRAKARREESMGKFLPVRVFARAVCISAI